ncbi:hypothetical protein BGZ63DRAFT_405814 [Mariannaea sp. PMI_226]|nr:hypothetical protein BGZ63DRAFT_405814 [Mariannaea sp. PMI_226]
MLRERTMILPAEKEGRERCQNEGDEKVDDVARHTIVQIPWYSEEEDEYGTGPEPLEQSSAGKEQVRHPIAIIAANLDKRWDIFALSDFVRGNRGEDKKSEARQRKEEQQESEDGAGESAKEEISEGHDDY